MMHEKFLQTLFEVTGATNIVETQTIQTLWSGYGRILRLTLQGGGSPSVIVKHVRLPDQSQHPRGWDSDLSHRRKVRSYQVETAWYQQWSQLCNAHCKVPEYFTSATQDQELFILLEDLDAIGFDQRKTQVNRNEMRYCLDWLANFHAVFMHEEPQDLWPVGTYWHLDTRPDELAVLSDAALKAAAADIDLALRSSPFQTFVHGDAKLANFCFSASVNQVAAVDFQYIGGGCGMKDVAYFMGSCLDERQCQMQEQAVLDYYFQALRSAIETHDVKVDIAALEQDWRALFPLAWTDFHRFIKGWSPGHWKINSYSERMARQVVEQLHH